MHAILAPVLWLIINPALFVPTVAGAIGAAEPRSGVPHRASTIVQEPVRQQPETPATAALVEGRRLLQRLDPEDARQQYERALELARAEGNAEVEGAAHRGLATILSRQTKYPEAKSELQRALRILDGSAAKAELAAAHRDLGTVEYFLNHPDAAREHYLTALAGFEALNDLAAQAGVCNSLTFVTDDEERVRFTQRGLDLATQAGAVETEARLLHSWSDFLFLRGRLAEATEKLDLAITRFEVAGESARSNFARALTSLGRLNRAHGHYDRALEAYRRGFQIQEALGDRSGMIQSLNAISTAYVALGRRREARPLLERALALARQTGSSMIIDFTTAALASDLIETDDPARGVAMMEQVVSRDTHRYYVFSGNLARGYFKLGQYARAIETADSALAMAREHGTLDLVQGVLSDRARAHEKLGHYDEALADVREAIALIERVRSDVIPTDAMKGGFAEQHQGLFTQAIELLHHLGQAREALDVAEQGRARAFADLLASREILPVPAARIEGSPPVKPAAEHASKAPANSETLTTRGGEAAVSRTKPMRSHRDLRSAASAAPLSSTELARVAARLHSTLVSYWVTPDATYIWVVTSTGDVSAVRVDVSERRLTELVRETWAVGDRTAPRGDTGRIDQQEARATLDPEPSVEADQLDARWTPRLRGDGLLSLGNSALVASRGLHRLLIEPIRHLLPSKSGNLLTVIPHGPLFLLSFAALQDAAGQYLVERHAIHYVPAGVVLQLAEQHTRASRAIDRRYLLVADPRTPPTLPGGKPLPRLPGTLREISQVAGLMPASRVTSLVGARATEGQVRLLAGNRSVIHFATHGVIRADDPLESFVALSVATDGEAVTEPVPGEGRRPNTLISGRTPSSQNDGRLTAREIYDIHLNADLVVLSACRTGLGRVSSDGVMGLARAFLYAGTPSVVATLWDVADEPAALLMPTFYRSLRRVSDKAQALRSAQLRLLKELRAGNVRVSSGSGSVTLREHPVLWAGFILVGQP